MAVASAELPRLLKIRDRESGVEVELALRSDYADHRVSVGELEALGPVLPELIAELFVLSHDQSRE